MRRKLKLNFYFLLVFIATSAGAQTSGFDPFHPDLPKMIISWETPACAASTYGIDFNNFTWKSIYAGSTKCVNHAGDDLYGDLDAIVDNGTSGVDYSSSSIFTSLCQPIINDCNTNFLDCFWCPETCEGVPSGQTRWKPTSTTDCGYANNESPPPDIQKHCQQVYSQNTSGTQNTYGVYVQAANPYSICDLATAAKEPLTWLPPNGCFQGNVAKAINKALKKECKDRLATIIQKFSTDPNLNDCSYISAKLVSVDLAMGVNVLMSDGEYESQIADCMDGRYDTTNGVTSYIFPDDRTDYVVNKRDNLFEYVGYNNSAECHMACGGTATSWCTENIKSIQFDIIEKEEGCIIHDGSADNKECRDCYEDRHLEPGAKRNPDRDGIHNSSPPTGGYIRSQGCIPQTGTQKFAQFGGNAMSTNPGDIAININSIISNPVTGVIDLFLPNCVTDPLPPPAVYSQFEGYTGNNNNPSMADPTAAESKQKEKAYNVVNREYDEAYTSAATAASYKGNCGRGKFFYDTIDAKDSNLSPNTSTQFKAIRSDSNDIWQSRTGCYNPEERFVLEQIGRVLRPQDENSTTKKITSPIKFHDPCRVVGNPVKDAGYIGAGFVALDADSRNEFIKSIKCGVDITDDARRPWDSPDLEIEMTSGTNPTPTGRYKDGSNVVIDGSSSAIVTYLVPNDRVLMRHPICLTENQTGIPSTDVNEILKALPNKLEAINSMILSDDPQKVKDAGSLPVCKIDDWLDDRDDFCSHYLQRTNENIAIGNVNLPISTKTNYNNPRYVFDAKDFCWKKTTDAIFENFDRDESWLPPAFKASQSSAIVVRKDIFGKDHNYETTDFIRPNLTHYASRVVKDVGIAGAAIPAYNHKLVSLEEYGYRDVPVARTDYQINPFNIYAPNTTQTFTREKLQVKANMGRKAKLQQCLRLYLEQWAFEGDKGAIVVDSSFKSKRIVNNETIQTAPDSSMCQWVAYYNTTDNQGKEDIFRERAQFKSIMMFYFSKLQDLNKEYASNNNLDEDDAMLGFTAVAGKPVFLTSTSFNNILPQGITFSPSNPIGSVMTTVLGTGSASAPGTDPERLQGISGNNPVLKINYATGNLEMDLDGAGNPGWGITGPLTFAIPTGLLGTKVSIGAPLDNMKTNEVEGEFDDKAFRRARGMRPEIFDYYNFLSFSSLSVMYEGLDITNKTTIGDGNPLSGNLEDVKNLTGSIGIDIPVLDNNLYTPSVKIEMSSPPSLASLNAAEIFNSIGWQANLERRNCNSVVPPHFWKDVVKPFAYGCILGQGSMMINNLAHSMKVLNGNTSNNWTVGSVFGTIWEEIDIMGKLTGGGNGPYRHWLTTDIEKPYISTITPIVSLPVYAVGFNIEKPLYFKDNWEKFQSPLSDEGIVMLEDNWLGRVGGMGNVSKNLIQNEWDGEAWIENTPMNAGNLTNQEDINKQNEYKKFYFNNLGAPSLGAGPASYAKNYSGYKEAKKQLGRGFLGVPILDESDLTDFKSREWVEHTWNANTCMHMRDTFDKPYNISKIILSDPIKKIDSTIQSLYLGELASNHPGKLDSQDAWKVNDDIDHTKAPPLLDLNPPSTTNPEDYYSKKFGGFKVWDNADPFFQWFPNSWSIAVGLNKAFWCELELPYNPYFTGDADFAFNKTRFKSHYPINNQKNLMFATNIPADAKPKLQLYRVERIRDACGPYGVRSTWVDDISPSQNIAKWLLNDYTDSDDDIDDYDALLNPKIQNRCGAWLDIYKKYHHDPKIISWRLPRFDYEFMKAFFDCTGPRRTVGPSPCKWNEAAHKENISNAIGEAMKGVMNVLLVVVQELLKGLGIDVDIPPTECIIATAESICAEFPNDIDGCQGVSVLDVVFAQASIVLGPLSQQMGVPVPTLSSPALRNGCYKNNNGEKFKLGQKIADNFLRAADYATRGDLYYGREEGNGNDPTDPETNMGSSNGTDPKFGLEGFRDHNYHSTQVQNYWLYKDNENNKSAFSEKINSDEPYGFWCSCPEDDLRTTRCREDFCTVDQHVLLVGRNLEFINKIQDLLTGAGGDQKVTVLGSNGENSASGTVIGCRDDTNGDGVVNGNDTQPTDPANCTNKVFADEEANKGIGKIAEIGTPVAIAKSYGPFRRWLQCYYQARAKACPVLTRDVSDTPAYSTLVDPFPADRVYQPELAEKTGKGQNFNVCDNANPAGVGNDQLDQFLRWSKEEPNHLARLAVAFESAGGGYKNQDFVFYTQVRDYEAPFMELAVPFPIDLITRYEVKSGTGGIPLPPGPSFFGDDIADSLVYCDSENIIANDVVPNPLDGNNPPSYPGKANYRCDKEKMNALGEINQREGTYEIDYNNPLTTTISTGTASNIVVKQKYGDFNIPAGATPNSTAGNAANEYDLKRIYDKAFRSSLIKKSNTGKIEPSSDADWDNEAYSSLYMKYIKGLYAAKKSYDHNARAGAPKTTLGDSYSSDDNRTNPRAEDTIVGPRGCDIGGWYEMMLYQARCIRWFGLNCICDYDKTFARGNAVNYSLRKGGMKFNVAYPALNQNTQFEVEAAVDRYGRTIKETAEDVAIDITGLQNPEIKVSDENKPVSSGELQYKLALNARGNYIPKTVGLGSFEIKYGNRLYPLSDRGNVGPEFAHNWKKSKTGNTLPTPQTTDYRFKGLSNVRVGDFIYWDESISTKVNGLDFDIGYPRHMAYVEKVNRLKGDDGKMHVVSITVSEMNWGKNLDSCGNTDMWGKTSYRVIKNPNLDPINSDTSFEVIPIAKIQMPIPKSLMPVKSPTEKYASCNNADWAVCVEKYWDQVNVYRPYKLQVVGCYDNDILKGRSNYMLYDSVGNPDPSYPAISTQAVASGSCFKQNASYLNLPTPITNERILALATSKNITNIPDTRTTDNSDEINIQTDMQTAISEYNTAYANSININLSESDIVDAKVATSVASSKIQKLRNMLSEYVKNNYTAQELIADDTLWKLTITKSDIYAFDEVENYLNNPLFGTLNRCDPPVTLRDNFNEVWKDTIDALTKKQSNGDWELDDGCQSF